MSLSVGCRDMFWVADLASHPMQRPDAESVRWRASNTLLSDEQLGRSVHVDAAQPRMTHLWARLYAGKPIKLGVIGASVAMEGGCQSQYQTQRCAAGRVQPALTRALPIRALPTPRHARQVCRFRRHAYRRAPAVPGQSVGATQPQPRSIGSLGRAHHPMKG